MGIGHAQKNKFHKQFSFFKTDWKHHYTHGGILRNKRKGRKLRALSCSEPLHVVFKINKSRLKSKSLRTSHAFNLSNKIIQHYAKYFFVKIEQVSIQNDHIHLLVRTSRRSLFHHFFRVVAGQIAQCFEKTGLLVVTDTPKKRGTKTRTADRPATETAEETAEHLVGKVAAHFWKYRPFSRVVRGYKAYRVVRDYIQLNEKEALGELRYSIKRLRGLSSADWSLLWS